MTKSRAVFSVVLFFPALVVLGFQNCAKFQPNQSLSGGPFMRTPVEPPAILSLKWDNSFAFYPSSEKPEFMAELSVKSVRVIDSSTSAIIIDGVIIKVDSPISGVNYEIRWYGSSGSEICSALTGTTTSTRTTFRYECLSTVSVGPQTRIVGRIYVQTQTAGKILVREVVRN
jgi:hypothetical protein